MLGMEGKGELAKSADSETQQTSLLREWEESTVGRSRRVMWNGSGRWRKKQEAARHTGGRHCTAYTFTVRVAV